jgi:ribonuclease P protein component
VSKAVGGAVVRNRTKRRLREIVRADLASLPPGVDLVVRANPASAEAPFTELQQTLKSLSHKVIRRLEASA